MTKQEMITKGINLDKEAQKLEQQKKEYVLNMISAETSIRKKWSEFATIFLTEEVLQEIEKTDYTGKDNDFFIGFSGLPDSTGKPIRICVNYFKNTKSLSFDITKEGETFTTKPLTIIELRNASYTLMNEPPLKADGTTINDWHLKTQAEKIKKYEIILKSLQTNINFFYEEISKRRNDMIEYKKEWVSNLPQFDTSKISSKQYKVVIKIEEI